MSSAVLCTALAARCITELYHPQPAIPSAANLIWTAYLVALVVANFLLGVVALKETNARVADLPTLDFLPSDTPTLVPTITDTPTSSPTHRPARYRVPRSLVGPLRHNRTEES